VIFTLQRTRSVRRSSGFVQTANTSTGTSVTSQALVRWVHKPIHRRQKPQLRCDCARNFCYDEYENCKSCAPQYDVARRGI